MLSPANQGGSAGGLDLVWLHRRGLLDEGVAVRESSPSRA